MRYTMTLGDGTALSVESTDSIAAHEAVARYLGIPRTHGIYVLFSRMQRADMWTTREIKLAIKQWNRS